MDQCNFCSLAYGWSMPQGISQIHMASPSAGFCVSRTTSKIPVCWDRSPLVTIWGNLYEITTDMVAFLNLLLTLKWRWNTNFWYWLCIFLIHVYFGKCCPKRRRRVWFFLSFANLPLPSCASISHLIQFYQFALIFWWKRHKMFIH